MNTRVRSDSTQLQCLDGRCSVNRSEREHPRGMPLDRRYGSVSSGAKA
jgi:hypothetical protein